MLVLSRKRNETIKINGAEIEIAVVNITGNRVKIGITAPATVSICRGEIYEPQPPIEKESKHAPAVSTLQETDPGD